MRLEANQNIKSVRDFTWGNPQDFINHQDSPVHFSPDEIDAMLLNRGLTIQQVIDSVIRVNGYIGVGLITLGDICKDYCYNKAHKK